MSHSPYTPPTSDVTPHNGPTPLRPKTVLWAANLLFLDCVLGLLSFLPGIATPKELITSESASFVISFIIVYIGLLIWCGSGILKGKNAARWALLAILAFGLSITFTTPPDSSQTIVRKVIDGISILMEAGVIVLLVLPPSRQWFRDCKALN